MKVKLHQDQKGIAHIAMVVLAVLILVIIGVVGWKVAGNKKASTTTSPSSGSSASNSAAVSSCLTTYHDSKLCNFAASANSFSKTSYTATLTNTQSGTTSSATLQSDGKGNTKLSTTANGSQLNSITLNGVTYIQTGGSATWIEYSIGSTAPTTDPTSNMNIGVGSAGISFKYVATEGCGSLSCYKYQVTDASAPTATQYVWFDNSGYKLRQWQYSDASGNTTFMTISYAAVNITKPSPVQQFSVGQ